MKLKYLLIVNNNIDEIVTIFKEDTPVAKINEHIKSFLDDNEWLQDCTDKFDSIQKERKENGFDSTPFYVMKHYLMTEHDTFVNLVETELEK
jgi:uncharacterized protein YqfA (UPF0365 family)